MCYPLPPMPETALTRLPEPEAVAALEQTAATAYGMADPACVVAAPGTQSLIHLLPRLRAPASVAVLSPTYGEHAAAWSQGGHRVTACSDPRALREAEVAVLCHPNNPDGATLGPAFLLDLAGHLAAKGGLLVADEAFADFEACSLAPALPHPALLLLRSFGKSYGLAGVRLGFALTSPAQAAMLRQALGPWAISGPALHAGHHALSDPAWRAEAAARLAIDGARLDRCLHRAGARVIGGTRLFRLAQHPDATALADRLAHAAILVRRFSERPTWLRFGLPAAEPAWTRLAAALA